MHHGDGGLVLGQSSIEPRGNTTGAGQRSTNLQQLAVGAEALRLGLHPTEGNDGTEEITEIIGENHEVSLFFLLRFFLFLDSVFDQTTP
jgi:hypothetical protein